MLDCAQPLTCHVQTSSSDPLPDGPFDLVISVLAVHHLDALARADLFGRSTALLCPSGRFVLADVIVPDDPRNAVTPVRGVHDKPSRLCDQLDWLYQAGLKARITWQQRDLVVVAAGRPHH